MHAIIVKVSISDTFSGKVKGLRGKPHKISKMALCSYNRKGRIRIQIWNIIVITEKNGSKPIIEYFIEYFISLKDNNFLFTG